MKTDTEARAAILAVLKHEGGLSSLELLTRSRGRSGISYHHLSQAVLELDDEGLIVASESDGSAYEQWSLP